MALQHLAIICLSSTFFSAANTHFPCWLQPKRQKLLGFHEWKWRNIVISLIHSFLSGSCALYLSLDYTFATDSSLALKSIRESSLSRTLLSFSIGYFIYDLLLSLSKVTVYPGRIEIIGHHLVTILILALSFWSLPLLTFEVMPYCVIGLVIELNNIFIHVRSLMELTQNSTCPGSNSTLYQANSACVVVSIVLFRFIPLLWIFNDINHLLRWMPLLWRIILNIPVAAIVLISLVIFVRIFKEDFLKSHKID